MSFIKDRPVVFWAALETVLKTGLAMLILFGALVMTPEEMAGVLLFFAALGGVFAFLVQGKVTPTVNPKDDGGNPLTPGPIGSESSEFLPPI